MLYFFTIILNGIFIIRILIIFHNKIIEIPYKLYIPNESFDFVFQLSVDNIAMSTRIESGGTRYLDLSDSFYLGGIESEKRQRAFAKGIKAADSSIMV